MTKRQYTAHKEKGLCTRCNEKVEHNKTLCTTHIKKSRMYQKEFYERHKYERKENISLTIGGY